MVTLEIIIADAREWIAECIVDHDDREAIVRIIQAASASVILGSVADNHDGGLDGFIRTFYGKRYYSTARAILDSEGF